MRNLFINSGIFFVTILLLFIVAEVGLRIFAPISVTNVGYVDRPNGEKYGWGFGPHELVRIETADSREVFYDRVNSNGWRDHEREIEKSPDAFRILVLGDSMTFGYLVPKTKVFTSLLQEKLQALDKNIEVINISYSGWGTDQAFEALKIDGAKYRPDLVIYHFVSNDPEDNIWHLDEGKFGTRKPFYYELVEGVPTRKINPRFSEEQNAITRKYLISKSQILQRAWLVSQGLKFRNEVPFIYEARRDSRIQHFLQIDDSHDLFSLLKASTQPDGEISEDEMRSYVQTAGLSETQGEYLRRILKNTPGNSTHLTSGEREPSNFTVMPWDLTKGLIRSMATYSNQIGADFAILSDTEEGRFNWDYFWRRVTKSVSARREYFEINEFLRDAIDSTEADLIPSPEPHERAQNDSHVNVAGNEAIASNLMRFILNKYPSKF